MREERDAWEEGEREEGWKLCVCVCVCVCVHRGEEYV